MPISDRSVAHITCIEWQMCIIYRVLYKKLSPPSVGHGYAHVNHARMTVRGRSSGWDGDVVEKKAYTHVQ